MIGVVEKKSRRTLELNCSYCILRLPIIFYKPTGEKPLGLLSFRTPSYQAIHARNIANHYGIRSGLVFIGIRGYYENSFGKKGANDLNVYDDALLVLKLDIKNQVDGYYTFQFNTDPSRYYSNVASLCLSSEFGKPYQFVQGNHNGSMGSYPAYRQYKDMMVRRANGRVETGYFGINFHKGGIRNTSSLACQTVPSAIWNTGNFLQLLDSLAIGNPICMDDERAGRGKHIVPYILVSAQEAKEFERREATASPRPIQEEPETFNTWVQALPTKAMPTPTQPQPQQPEPQKKALESHWGWKALIAFFGSASAYISEIWTAFDPCLKYSIIAAIAVVAVGAILILAFSKPINHKA